MLLCPLQIGFFFVDGHEAFSVSMLHMRGGKDSVGIGARVTSVSALGHRAATGEKEILLNKHNTLGCLK